MPKSRRCGECNLPIKGHRRRKADKACIVVTKIRKNGNKKQFMAP